MRTHALIATTAAALLASGCTMRLDERVTGTAIGAGVGAVAGGLVGGSVGAPWTGAGLGAAAGGTAGYYIGKHLKCDRERQEELDATKGGGCGCTQRPVGPVASVDSVPPPPRSAPLPPVARSANPAEAARIEYEMGRSATSADRALRHYEEAIRLDPSRPEPHNARGMILAWQGRTEEAKRAYAQALALDPGYRPAIDNLQGLAAR